MEEDKSLGEILKEQSKLSEKDSEVVGRLLKKKKEVDEYFDIAENRIKNDPKKYINHKEEVTAVVNKGLKNLIMPCGENIVYTQMLGEDSFNGRSTNLKIFNENRTLSKKEKKIKKTIRSVAVDAFNKDQHRDGEKVVGLHAYTLPIKMLKEEENNGGGKKIEEDEVGVLSILSKEELSRYQKAGIRDIMERMDSGINSIDNLLKSHKDPIIKSDWHKPNEEKDLIKREYKDATILSYDIDLNNYKKLSEELDNTEEFTRDFRSRILNEVNKLTEELKENNPDAQTLHKRIEEDRIQVSAVVPNGYENNLTDSDVKKSFEKIEKIKRRIKELGREYKSAVEKADLEELKSNISFNIKKGSIENVFEIMPMVKTGKTDVKIDNKCERTIQYMNRILKEGEAGIGEEVYERIKNHPEIQEEGIPYKVIKRGYELDIRRLNDLKGKKKKYNDHLAQERKFNFNKIETECTSKELKDRLKSVLPEKKDLADLVMTGLYKREDDDEININNLTTGAALYLKNKIKNDNKIKNNEKKIKEYINIFFNSNDGADKNGGADDKEADLFEAAMTYSILEHIKYKKGEEKDVEKAQSFKKEYENELEELGLS